MQRIFIKELGEKVGERVKICGWVDVRRDHGKLIFIDLRDSTGKIQVVAGPGLAEKIRSEWVVNIEGEVKKRPEAMINKEIPLGDLEMSADKIEVLSESKTPPFDIGTDGYDVNEEIRLKYRYLDLRRDRLQKNLRMRHKIIKFIRDYLDNEGFVEIETPIISKSTPEGARDYVVPSRLYPGKFYALPQSPQQYKQLLMVAGFEKYYQIVRCFRDEDTRGDRQPEFTQLDLEMSFATQEDILGLIEDLYIKLVEKLFPQHRITQTPFPRLKYSEVMEKYGTDKPDLRKDKNNHFELAFAFVVDFPMFEWKEREKRWDAVHHPFTKINLKSQISNLKSDEEIIDYIKKNPDKLSAHQYDFVL
ncbi:MAG: aspartate--tRNA ligase, partial [Candidatus Parcubacteria bacterium]|nr:aspartate--tRNA ligase [Candidatus Parcubacteria bacterium]